MLGPVSCCRAFFFQETKVIGGTEPAGLSVEIGLPGILPSQSRVIGFATVGFQRLPEGGLDGGILWLVGDIGDLVRVAAEVIQFLQGAFIDGQAVRDREERFGLVLQQAVLEGPVVDVAVRGLVGGDEAGTAGGPTVGFEVPEIEVAGIRTTGQDSRMGK